MRTVLDALSASVYVISLRNGEVLHANKTGQKRMQLMGLENRPKCYNLFCGRDTVCSQCRAVELGAEHGGFENMTDEALLRYFEEDEMFSGHTVLWEGIPARVETRAQGEGFGCFNRRERDRITALMGKCVCMLSFVQSAQQGIGLILEQLCGYFRAESVAFYEMDPQMKALFLSGVYPKERDSDYPDGKGWTYSRIHAWFQSQNNFAPILIPQDKMEKMMPAQAYASMKRIQARMVMVVPVVYRRALCGFAMVLNPREAIQKTELIPSFTGTLMHSMLRLKKAEAQSAAETKEQKVVVRMLGDLTLQNDEGLISGVKIHSEQVIKLLAYLLLNKNSASIPVQKLADVLWNSSVSGDPYAALRNLAYRARTVLRPLFPEESLLVAAEGTYRLNPKLDIISDVELFEETCRQYFAAGEDRRAEILQEILRLYGGPLLPMLSTEEWVLPLSGYYNSQFLSIVQDGARILLERGDHGEVFRVCSRGLEVDGLNETLHSLLMESLYRQGNRGLALDYYDKVARMYERDLGMMPDAGLRRLRNAIANGSVG